jgi:hypothetical protein
MYVYEDNLTENGGSGKPPSRYRRDLKFGLMLIWASSRNFAKFQVQCMRVLGLGTNALKLYYTFIVNIFVKLKTKTLKNIKIKTRVQVSESPRSLIYNNNICYLGK